MAIPSCPTTFWLEFKAAKAHAARREYDCAIITLSKVLEAVDPQVRCPKTGTEPPYKAYCEAHYERGLAYAHKKKHDDAIRDFDAVIAIAKTPAVKELIKIFLTDAYLQRGILFVCKGETRQAISDFSEVIGLDSCNHEAFYHRAVAFHEAGDMRAAAEDFARVEALNPHGFPKLREAFLSIAPSKAWPTFPDTKMGTQGEHKLPAKH